MQRAILAAALAMMAMGSASAGPPTSTYVHGKRLGFDECKARADAALRAEGYADFRDFGNGWTGHVPARSATVGCVHSVDPTTVVFIVVAGDDAGAAKQRLADRMSGSTPAPAGARRGECASLAGLWYHEGSPYRFNADGSWRYGGMEQAAAEGQWRARDAAAGAFEFNDRKSGLTQVAQLSEDGNHFTIEPQHTRVSRAAACNPDAAPPASTGSPDIGASPAPSGCPLAGTWTAQIDGLGQSTWALRADGSAQEQGLGNAHGSARVDGRMLSIQWVTGGYGGDYAIQLDESCATGQGTTRWLSTPPGVAPRSFATRFTRVP